MEQTARVSATCRPSPASFIAGKLKDFRKGADDPTVMNRIAKGFTDAEIEAITEKLEL